MGGCKTFGVKASEQLAFVRAGLAKWIARGEITDVTISGNYLFVSWRQRTPINDDECEALVRRLWTKGQVFFASDQPNTLFHQIVGPKQKWRW